MASKRRNMFQKNKTQETTENVSEGLQDMQSQKDGKLRVPISVESCFLFWSSTMSRRSEKWMTEGKVNKGNRGRVRAKCYTPWCLALARQTSKYCSDDCALNLATMRIKHILPQKLISWNETRSHAESKDRADLEELAAEQKALLKLTDELYLREKNYHETLTKAKSELIDPDWAAGDLAVGGGSEAGVHESVYCVSCGAEVHLRSASKHIERCYNKYELYFTGSPYGVNIANVYCNRYNERDKTFCKRLRVMCGEHNADQPNASSCLEVCGFPLVTDVFTETGHFCRAPKVKCLRHVSWDKFRQAELDSEKVKLYVKFKENMLKQRDVAASLENRGGVLQIMLHTTVDHSRLPAENRESII
ncbi:hypothetical protein AAG570_013565 [Ranatra chinensis]|uniref:CXXC-type zinc finger protein 1 n=1 Tax=Ranatra chinensis TaxID=642074 RepID=A0ABD0YCK6_9HEMI